MCLRRILLAVLLVGFAASKLRPADLPSALDRAGQLILVVNDDWDAVPARLWRFERKRGGGSESKVGEWQVVGQPVAAVLGHSGIGWMHQQQAPAGPRKREGDGRSPAGLFSIRMLFGAAPTADFRLPYQQMTATWQCVDDAASPEYNRVLDAATQQKTWKSHEDMLIPLYKWGAVIEANPGRTANAGSCIFLHIGRDVGKGSLPSGTAGCTALAEPELLTLMHWLNGAEHPVLVQLPRQAYRQYQREWKLPRVTFSQR